MPKRSDRAVRYGIGEWYGQRIDILGSQERLKYARSRSIRREPCPFRPREMCVKKGGVCSLIKYSKSDNGGIILDPDNEGLVTVCPVRFWQNNTIFLEVGKWILETDKPILIKEIGFLQGIDKNGHKTDETVGRIDMVLVKIDEEEKITEWCALEIQAVYFSGTSMGKDFKEIANNPDDLVLPSGIRRPDFRSSGPKRLMPQLQIKIPALRRWGKKMVVVVDRQFFESIAPMKEAPDISNADIAWFVVDYTGAQGELSLIKTVLTTLENSVKGLTAGLPITKEDFEKELSSYLAEKPDKVVRIS